MKKTILSVFGLLSVGVLSAQTIVSTTPANKVPVLEEYTGVNCQHCPDGHKEAEGLLIPYPNAVLVNVHVGSFAPATPPYLSPWGTALDAAAKVSGYPAGSVNRQRALSGVTYNVVSGVSAHAMYRNYFSTAFSSVAAQSSPVNIAIEPTYDEGTREMTLKVEVYYTGSTLTVTDSTDYLTVAILQNNVKGPQIDGGDYYPENRYPDGDYNHGHMLRHFMTGQWGIEMEPTGSGFFWDSTFVYTIPNTINGLDASDLTNLEIAAFVHDTKEDILTATSEYLVPENERWDLSFTSSLGTAADYCLTDASPSISVKNDGSATITDFKIDYYVNGVSSGTYSYTGSLAPSATDNFTIPTISVSGGLSVISFSKAYDVNGGALHAPDPGVFAKKADAVSVITLDSGFELPIEDDFEDYDAGDQPDVFHVVETNGSWPIVLEENYYNWIENSVGAHGESDQSLYFPLGYSSVASGTAFSVVSDNYDFSEFETVKLNYSYAYGSLESNDNSEFTIDVSTDCGANWDNVYEDVGEDMNTSGVDAASIIIPEEDEWEDVSVDLSEYAGEAEVMVRFRIVKDECNTLFLDEIAATGSVTSIAETGVSLVKMYPNPAQAFVSFSGLNENTSVKVYDMQGRLVMSTVVSSNVGLDISGLDAGSYSISLENETIQTTERLTVLK